jgi:hypothetical protein
MPASAPASFEPRDIGVPDPGVDIIPVSATDKPIRLRGSGKLLVGHGGLGLALLRGEHLEATDNGQALLQIRASDGQTFNVQHWWPEAWPDRPAPDSKDNSGMETQSPQPIEH